MPKYIAQFSRSVYRLTSFFLALGTLTLFVSALPVLFISLVWLD